MPGIAKLGPVELNKLETTDEHKSKSNLTEALKWPRGIVVSGKGLLSLDADHGENGSHESDHDLAAMVRDFIENGSVGQDGNCHSSDSDTGSTSIRKHGESIMALKNSITPMESDLLSRIKVVIASIKDTDLLCFRDGSCKGSCIRRQLVKHLKSFGYNAAVCKSKWKVSEKVPGGEYEYMDVILEGDEKAPERLIVDIEFQSHFEIARPIVSYDTILKSIPVIYVGGLVKLERMLQLLVEAAKFSLKQNSMPIPPWRTLGYLRAKWFSSHERVVVDTPSKYHRGGLNMEWMSTDICPKQCQCRDQLRRLKASLPPEAESGRVLKAISIGRNGSILTDWRSNALKSLRENSNFETISSVCTV